MDTNTLILTNVLGCGTSDVGYICSLLDDFKVEIDDIDWRNDANDVIYQIFQQALSNADFDFDKHCDDYSVYTNYLDSHLYIDGEEVYSHDELVLAIEKLNNENQEV